MAAEFDWQTYLNEADGTPIEIDRQEGRKDGRKDGAEGSPGGVAELVPVDGAIDKPSCACGKCDGCDQPYTSGDEAKIVVDMNLVKGVWQETLRTSYHRRCLQLRVQNPQA